MKNSTHMSVILGITIWLSSLASVQSMNLPWVKIDKLRENKIHEATALRGKKHDGGPIVAPQEGIASKKFIHIKEGKARPHEAAHLHAVWKTEEASENDDFATEEESEKDYHEEATVKFHQSETTGSMCRGSRFRWMVQIRQDCKEDYGDESIWDRNRGDGACREAWQECNSGFKAQCCTQPEGPRSMGAYCGREENANDQACHVQNRMSNVQQNMNAIRTQVASMHTAPPPQGPPEQFTVISGGCQTTDGGMCVVSPNFPAEYGTDEKCEIKAPSRGVSHPRVKVVAQQWNTESCCDKLIIDGERFSGEHMEEGPDVEVSNGPVMTWSTDFSEEKPGWKVCAEDIIPPTPPPFGFPVPGPGPAPAMPSGLAAAPAPAAPLHGPPKATLLQTDCQKLQDIVNNAAKEIEEIRRWAEHDGIIQAGAEGAPAPPAHGTSLLSLFAGAFRRRSTEEPVHNPQDTEATDPDLTFAVRRVLDASAGITAMSNNPVCNLNQAAAEVPEDDDDDDDGDDGKEEEEEEDDEEEEDPEAVQEQPEEAEVNDEAIGALLEGEGKMADQVQGFEKGVHPHGRKWWRYRYQYTLVESFVIAFNCVFVYVCMWVLAGASFFNKFKFYNIGLPSRLYRYGWAYLMFHGAALIIQVALAYFLYMPWGESNLFDVFAKALHKWVDGYALVPYTGYSWLLLILNVQLEMFVMFVLYSIFITGVTFNFARALEDWRSMAVGSNRSRRAINEYLYKDFEQIMTRRVQDTEALQQIFPEKRLRLSAVPETDPQNQYNEFQIHVYFTDVFGEALEYLVEVSIKSLGVLAGSALLVAALAHHFQLAFMYYCPFFIALGLICLAGSWLVSVQLRSEKHGLNFDYLNVHAYCRAIQILNYAIFFSFARLLLSNDIFTDYPRVYVAALIGLIAVILLHWFLGADIMKATLAHVSLPHRKNPDRFGRRLLHVSYWHIVTTCHECGVRQVPPNASTNREWAGTQIGSTVSPRFEKTGGTPRTPPYSFR